MAWWQKTVCGDCRHILPQIPKGSIDLIFTSPPYAEQRSRHYPSIPEDRYAEWWCDTAEQFRRALGPGGNLVWIIKEHTKDGSRSTYVYEAVTKMVRECGWRLIDDIIWIKSNPFPGDFGERLKDDWGHCYHMAPTKQRVRRFPMAVAKPPSMSTLRQKQRFNHTSARRVERNAMRSINEKQCNAIEMAQPPNTSSTAVVICSGVARLCSKPRLWVNRLPQSLHWNAGPDSQARGEDFRVRVNLKALKRIAPWRVQEIICGQTKVVQA